MSLRFLSVLAAIVWLAVLPVHAQQPQGATPPRGDPAPVQRIRTPADAGMSFVIPTSEVRYVSLPVYHSYAIRSISETSAVLRFPSIPHLSTTLPSGLYDQQSTPLLILPVSR